mmetsp:Transcript_16266/g.53138  ORF Transcript_16266/g.53138 Transcript_16266/m.53138 type:complete len:347 (+) Transcript_16266:159-1199(+)
MVLFTHHSFTHTATQTHFSRSLYRARSADPRSGEDEAHFGEGVRDGEEAVKDEEDGSHEFRELKPGGVHRKEDVAEDERGEAVEDDHRVGDGDGDGADGGVLEEERNGEAAEDGEEGPRKDGRNSHPSLARAGDGEARHKVPDAVAPGEEGGAEEGVAHAERAASRLEEAHHLVRGKVHPHHGLEKGDDGKDPARAREAAILGDGHERDAAGERAADEDVKDCVEGEDVGQERKHPTRDEEEEGSTEREHEGVAPRDGALANLRHRQRHAELHGDGEGRHVLLPRRHLLPVHLPLHPVEELVHGASVGAFSGGAELAAAPRRSERPLGVARTPFGGGEVERRHCVH